MTQRRILTVGCAAVMFTALLWGGAAGAQNASPTATTPAGQTYTVQSGDNLSKIAQRFGVSLNALMDANNIRDPNVIRLGQTLIIPIAGATSTRAAITATPSATSAAVTTAEATAVYDTVRSGDTLASIARRNDTTLEELIRLNNIVNPDLILVGQRVIVRAGRIPATNEPGVSSTASSPESTFGTGLTIFIQDQPPASVVQQVAELPLDWVKIDVSWEAIEPAQGIFNFVVLDEAVNALNRANINILLTLSGDTPVWARTVAQEDGPPDDFAAFATYTSTMAAHFEGRVAAYQIWNEPNLRRQWSSDRYRIDPASYFDLLRQAYAAIKAADPTAMVISAGLAPTGFNDGVNALNDRLYLQSLYDLGLKNVTDAVAVHAVGFANPPDAECCQKSNGVETHYENRSFYFKNTLDDYHAITQANGDERPLWVTKFGWGTSEDTETPGEGFVYVTYNSLVEQATYIPGAYNLARTMGYIGPMFLYNFNGCQFNVPRPEECYFSLLGPSGSPRAAFNTLRAMR
jgi:polysaccharide biosynthesis protein PslG